MPRRRQHRARSLYCHPDKVGGRPDAIKTEAVNVQQDLNAALDILADDKLREDFCQGLLDGLAGGILDAI